MNLVPTCHINADSSADWPPDGRRVTEHAHCFSINHADGTMIGALLDYTAQDFGFEVFELLKAGQGVTLKGDVDVNGVWKRVYGSAQVVSCEPACDGGIRLELSAEDMTWATTFDPNIPFLQRAPCYAAG